MAQRIYRHWDTIEHPNKDLIDKDGLCSGGSYIKFTNRIEWAARALVTKSQQKTQDMKFDILALRKAIDEWSMNMGEENIQIHIPDNSAKERTHLGLSEICTECPRAAWFSFRKVYKKPIEPRIMRLFQRGHREEFFFTQLLRGVGIKVWEDDPSTGKPFKVSECEGHLKGTMDRVGRDFKKLYTTLKKAFLIEFKTSNNKRFNALVKEGLKKSNPTYFGQVQGYMGLQPKLGGCLFMSVNKDTDEIYIEWVTPDSDALQHILQRAEDIINATSPIDRISKRKSFWKCKMCDFKDHCHDKGKKSDVSCRSCKNARPIENGEWKCVLSKETYGTVCDRWEDCNG